MRWVATMVADVHRILHARRHLHVPADAREPDKPGKLRLMYEANPMALLVEQAGGAATNGKQRILDVQPTKLHQRVPVFLGSQQRSRLRHAAARRVTAVLGRARARPRTQRSPGPCGPEYWIGSCTGLPLRLRMRMLSISTIDREGHREVDVALGHVVVEALGDQHHADDRRGTTAPAS